MEYPEKSTRINAALAYHTRHAQVSVRSLARKWDVPESTLRDKLKGRPTLREARATQQLLPPSQEALLAN
jgi:hypothetical protein